MMQGAGLEGTSARRLISPFVALAPVASLCLASPAEARMRDVAQDQQARDTGQKIVVTGQRPVSERATRLFVDHITIPVEGQLARFHDPLCPAVSGVKPAAGSEIADRMAAIASEAGMRLAGEGCEPNLIVMIVRDGRKALKHLKEKGALRGLTDTERRRLLSAEGPAYAFSDTQLQNDDGVPMGASTNTVGAGASAPRAALGGNLTVRTASITHQAAQQATLRTIVILEAAALMGKSLVQIADYAAMWGIGGARRNDSGGLGQNSILSLFELGAGAPPGLTVLDRAFLKGVYAAEPNQNARIQLQQIARDMMNAVEQP